MLFKSDVPVSHRMVLVLAVILTAKVLVDLRIRSAFAVLEVCVATALWLVVFYTSMKRLRWRAQKANGNIEGYLFAFQTRSETHIDSFLLLKLCNVRFQCQFEPDVLQGWWVQVVRQLSNVIR